MINRNLLVFIFFLLLNLCDAQISNVNPKSIFELIQTQAGVISNLQSVSDGKGGVYWIFRSVASQTNFSQIQVRYTAQNSKEQWVSPVIVTQSKFSQHNPIVAKDLNNGLIVAWEERRDDSLETDIFCQRIDIFGQKLWGDSGICALRLSGIQRCIEILPDNAGGFYISWIHEIDHNAEKDIGIQYLDLNGRYKWDKSGVYISRAKGTQVRPVLALEPGKSVICVWEDYRNQQQWQLYGQKISHSGNPEWEKDGLLLLPDHPHNQRNPTIVGDGYGGFMCVYEASGLQTEATDLYFVRISRIGTIVFETIVCSFSDNQLNPNLFKFGSYVYLFWEDYRKGNADLYWQKMDLYTGKVLWSTEGQVLCSSPGKQTNILITEGDAGTFWAVWHDFRQSASQLFAQQLNTDGKNLGELNGFLISQIPAEANFTITANNQGEIWVGFLNDGITQLKINTERKIRGIQTSANQRIVYAHIAQIVIADGQRNDFYIAWQDFRRGEKEPDIYMLRVSLLGKPLWAEPLAVCVAQGEQSRPVLLAKNNAVFVVWVDRRTGKDENLYLQKVDSSGVSVWPQNGVPVCTAPRSQNSPKITETNQGIMVLWNDARNFETHGFDIYGQYYDLMGNIRWAENGIPIVAGPGYQTTPKTKQVDDQKIALSWMDDRSGFYNIYVGKLSLQGNLLWEKALAPASYNQRNQSIDSDPTGIVVAWSEDRFSNKFEKICTQKITWSGEILWGERGQLVCENYGKQTYPKILIDQSYGAVITWIGEQNPVAKNSLVIQRLNLMGKPIFHSNGLKLGENLPENPQTDLLIYNNTITAVWIQQNYTGNNLAHFRQLDLWTGDPINQNTRILDDPKIVHQEIISIYKSRVYSIIWIEQTDSKQAKIMMLSFEQSKY